MKKLMLLLLVMSHLIYSIFFAMAEEPAGESDTEWFRSGDYLCYSLDDASAIIVRYYGDAEELTVPVELEGKKITGIWDDAYMMDLSLKIVTIPDSVTDIGANPFGYCIDLSTIIVSDDHPTLMVVDGVLFNKPGDCLICYPRAFKDDSYVIPDGTRVIGESAFYENSSLKEIIIPDSVTSLGKSSFEACFNLEKVTIPDSVTSIGDRTFCYCFDLDSITIPDSVTSIGVNPFGGCDSLQSITVSREHPVFSVVDGVLFSKPDQRLVCYPCVLTAETYLIPEETRIIGEGAFHSCSLISVVIPDSVVRIDDYAFCDCPALTDLIIGNGVISIGMYAFSDCTSLINVILPDSVTSIGDYAFHYCSSLTAITIPGSVTNIGQYAFSVYQDHVLVPLPLLTARVPHYSYAEQYCIGYGLNYIYSD